MVARQLLEGPSVLHRGRITHRELKPHNTVVDRQSARLFITNLDLALQFEGDDDVQVGFAGPVSFTTSEVRVPDCCQNYSYQTIPEDLLAAGELLLANSTAGLSASENHLLRDVAGRTDKRLLSWLSVEGVLAFLLPGASPSTGQHGRSSLEVTQLAST